MMWYEPLYTGEKIRRRADHLRKRLDSGKTVLDHYVITFSQSEHDNLDVMSTSYLTQDALRDRLPAIVGIAHDRAEAMQLVLQITEECVEKTGGADIRNYLLGNGRIVS